MGKMGDIATKDRETGNPRKQVQPDENGDKVLGLDRNGEEHKHEFRIRKEHPEGYQNPIYRPGGAHRTGQ